MWVQRPCYWVPLRRGCLWIIRQRERRSLPELPAQHRGSEVRSMQATPLSRPQKAVQWPGRLFAWVRHVQHPFLVPISFFLCLCLRRPGSHVAYARACAYACACVVRVDQPLVSGVILGVKSSNAPSYLQEVSLWVVLALISRTTRYCPRMLLDILKSHSVVKNI